MIGYGVMSMVMTATPLAMVGHGHAFGDAAIVIQWHIVGMFAPSFFTGHLIRRFGVLQVMLVGAAFLFVAIAAGATGSGFANYWTGLFCLGLGWNFLFIGGTTLLTETHTEAEKAKVQGLKRFTGFRHRIGGLAERRRPAPPVWLADRELRRAAVRHAHLGRDRLACATPPPCRPRRTRRRLTFSFFGRRRFRIGLTIC